MPVIRGQATVTVLTAERKSTLLEQLANELAGRSDPNGPLIFEIPLEQLVKTDVLVVWQAFQGLRSEDRTDLILEAYKDQPIRIAQALGVTHQEAIEQALLPYAVIPMSRRDEVNPAELRQAMLSEGGIAHSEQKVELRFPTMAMAEAAHQRLCEKLPKGYWSIAQTVAPIP